MPSRTLLCRSIGHLVTSLWVKKIDKEEPFLEENAQAALKQCRAKRRVALLAEVRWQGQNAVELGKTHNISETGLLVKSTQTLPVDSELEVRFVVPVPPDVVAVKTMGKVVWERPGVTMGIQFLDLKEEYREAIAKFVQRTQT